MQNLILCENLYNDSNSLSTLISTLEFEDCLYGKFVKDFDFTPQGIDTMICNVLRHPVEVINGTFIKPNRMIHHDSFYEHTLWTCIVAMENTTLKVHEHESGSKGFFDIPDENKEQFFLDNSMNPDKWTTTSVINMKENDFVFIRPWLWKSLEEGKLIQKFTINIRINAEPCQDK